MRVPALELAFLLQRWILLEIIFFKAMGVKKIHFEAARNLC